MLVGERSQIGGDKNFHGALCCTDVYFKFYQLTLVCFNVNVFTVFTVLYIVILYYAAMV